MAEEEIIIRYKVDVTGIKQAGVAVDNVTDKIGDMGAASKAAFASKELDNVVEKLYEQGDVMGALIQRYGDAGKALKAVNKELNTMAVLGQGGTKEFKELSKAAAELTDTIDDTRGAVKKLASDTRTLDLMAQGVRAVTAGFSVATGAMAVFGKESEDMQKAILRVQGALALMQGAQELATIATEKGGIAQAAYTFVVGQSVGAMKAFRIALAATGIGLAVVAIAALYENWDKLNDAIREYLGLQPLISKDKVDAQQKTYEQIKEIYEREIELKRANGEDTKQLELQRIKDLRGYLDATIGQYRGNADAVKFTMDERHRLLVKQKTLEKQVHDEQLKQDADFFEKRKQKFVEETQQFIDAVSSAMTDDKDTIGEQMKQAGAEMQDKFMEGFTGQGMAKVPEIDFKPTIAPLGPELAAQQFMTEFADALTAIAPTVNAFADLGRSIFAAETQALETEKNKQLAIAGDNAQKREKIEKDFAIKRAKLARQQAIADKAFATFNAVVGLAQAISKTIADNGFPAAIPFIALAAATGAAQIAAIAASPLPEIPQFAEGGAVPLIGGKIRPDGAIIGRSHRSGGVLIEAEGGEFINNTVSASKYADELRAANEMRLENLIMHKYVAPAIEEERRKARAAIQHISVNNEFDDALLRKTVRDSARENAVYVANKVAETVSDSIYFKQRYK